MLTRQEKQAEAQRLLAERKAEQEQARTQLRERQFPEAGLDETEIMQALYFHESDKLMALEKTVLDITKANFAVFGAIMLLSSTPYLADLTRSKAEAAVVAAGTIMIVSFAASFLAVLYYKYLSVHAQKVSILQRGVWRRRPLHWVQLKYTDEGIKWQFIDAASLGFVEYVTYSYIFKEINLIPFGVALLILGVAILFILGVLDPTAAVVPAGAGR